MHELAPLILDLAIILGVAGIVTILFQKIHQPIVLGYLVAGIIIGPHTPPHPLVTDIPNIKILSELGVIFLMFSLGLHFSFHKLARVGFSAGITGTLEVVLMVILGFVAGKFLDWSFHDCLFLGAALAISSTTIIIKAIEELHLIKKRFAELIFGILVVEDLLAILLLVALSTVVITKSIFSLDMVWAAGKLILVVTGWFVAGYFLIPTLLRKIMQYASEETITVVSIGLCLFLVSIAAHLHYSTALGAFIMGSVLAETPLIHRIEQLIKPIRDIFAAVFFVSVGMLMDPQIIIEQWPAVLFITLLTIVGKLFTTSLGALLTGQNLTSSVRSGFAMAQIGEFSFIIIGLGISLNAVNSSLYPIIVAVSIITTFTTPYLIRFSGYLTEVADKRLPKKARNFIERYSSTINRLTSNSNQESIFKNTVTKLTVNGIIVAIIFTLINKLTFPYLNNLLNNLWTTKTVCWLSALLISSPFIWGMFFSYAQVKPKKISLNIKIFLIWLISIIEITVLSSVYFQNWIISSITIFTFILFFIVGNIYLKKTYLWLENQLVKNIKQQDINSTKYEEIGPWDTHLTEMTVSDNALFADKTLRECQIRENYGINIVAIMRNRKIIFAPRGAEKLSPQDKLVILGSDQQIDLFKKNIESQPHEDKNSESLENIVLKTITLESNNPLINKTIRESKIREQARGLIVGLERNGIKILNPNPSTVLQLNDHLLIAGDQNDLGFLEKS